MSSPRAVMVVATMAAVCLLAGTGTATAQPAGSSAAPAAEPSTFYLQAGAVVSVHREGEQYFRTSPPLSGTTPGGSIAIGARLTSWLSADAELMGDSTVSVPQTDIYTSVTTYTAKSRDVAVGVNLRMRPLPKAPVEFTVGGGLAFTRFERSDVVTTYQFPPATVRGPNQKTSIAAPTLSASLGAAIPLGRRVALVPAAGVRWIRREFDTEAWYLGAGRYSYTLAAALRVGL